MKIIVVSDSHGNYSLLNEIYLKHFDASFFYHLGDSQLPEYMLHSYCGVKGNCDFIDLPTTRDIEIEGYKIHLEHGNNFHFQVNPEKYIENLECDIFLFGHTHKKLATKIKNTFVFNPGSLTRPRDGEKGSYLILEINKNEEIKYKFVEIDLNN